MHALVIEDEPRIRAFLSRALEAEGFEVDGADNGVDGLARALRGSHDIVLLDLLRPRADGLTVLPEIGRRLPALPGLVLSPRPDRPTKLAGFPLALGDHLAKPLPVADR